MRLLYQSFGQEEGMQAYRQELQSLVKRAVSPDTQVILGSLPSALIEGKGFGSAHALDTPKLLKRVAEAVAGDIQGVAIGNAFDPGLWEARELFDVPILGWFETVAMYGMRVGWRVGILCSGTSGPPRIEELAIRYGIAGRLSRPVALGVRVPEVLAAFDDTVVAQRLIAEAEDAASVLARSGAEVLMVASGVLDVLLQSRNARTLSQVVVLPGVQILLQELEAAVRLAEAGVPFISRSGRYRKPPNQVMQALQDF